MRHINAYEKYLQECFIKLDNSFLKINGNLNVIASF